MRLLQGGEILGRNVQIGGSNFSMTIDPNPIQPIVDSGKAGLQLILGRSEPHLTLCATPVAIQRLSDIGKSKEGISAHVDGLDIFLQIDVRTDSRP